MINKQNITFIKTLVDQIIVYLNFSFFRNIRVYTAVPTTGYHQYHRFVPVTDTDLCDLGRFLKCEAL